MSADRSAPIEARLPHAGARQVAGDAGVGEIGAIELGADQLGGEQAGAAQAGAGEIGIERPGLIEHDAVEIGARRGWRG